MDFLLSRCSSGGGGNPPPKLGNMTILTMRPREPLVVGGMMKLFTKRTSHGTTRYLLVS